MDNLIRKIDAQKMAVLFAATLVVAVIFGMVMAATQDGGVDLGAAGRGHTH